MRKCLPFVVFLAWYIFQPGYCIAQNNNDSLLHIIATSKDDNELVTVYNDYAYQLYRTDPDSAISCAKKAIEIAQKIKNNTEIFSGYNLIGLALQTKGSLKLS